MKNLPRLTAKFCIMSALSAAIIVAAGAVSAEQGNATFTSSQPILLASTSFSGKPPFNRHADAKQVVNGQQVAGVSLKSLKWKPPFKRHLHRQDNLHNVQVAQIGEVTSDMIGNTDIADRKLKGSKPPFKRN